MTASMYRSGTPDDPAEVSEALLGKREVLVGRVLPGADPGDALVDDCGRVRHRADDRHR